MQYLTLAIDCGTIRVSISSGISFSSYPPGADIYVIVSGTGLPINTGFKTPKIINLPAGDYDYMLKLAGFEDYTGTVTVNPDEITYIDINLIPKPSVLNPALVAAGGVSMLGIILATTAQKVIPITTGRLGGKVVTVVLD